ncbi:MAG: hypothetical protein HKO65_20380 [Gemmatimonadetes bacterium]|nr:hypothetical protein [Gemmatimonadota bacterium]
MIPSWILAVGFGVLTGIGARYVYRRWRSARIAAKRVVEKPNSHYASAIVKNQIDRERWGQVNLESIHPLNREEVERLLAVADVQGPEALSARERLFLETMTSLSFG